MTIQTAGCAVAVLADGERVFEQRALRCNVQRAEMVPTQQRQRCVPEVEPGLWIEPPAQDVRHLDGAKFRPVADRETIARLQRSSPERAYARVQVGAAAAEHWWRGESSAYGQITPATVAHAAQLQHAAGGHDAARPSRQPLLAHVCIRGGASQRDHRGHFKAQCRASQREFQRCIIGPIAHQGVGQSPGRPVHHARAPHAQRGMAHAAAILQRAQQTGLQHRDAHRRVSVTSNRWDSC